MRIIAFLTDYALVERIINHLKLTFVAERSPPRFQQACACLVKRHHSSSLHNSFVFNTYLGVRPAEAI